MWAIKLRVCFGFEGLMPSKRFGANAAWFRINVLVFNLLTILKRQALPKRFSQARPKCLRFQVFTVPAELRTHQSRLTVRMSAADQRITEIISARNILLEKYNRNNASSA